MKKRLFKILSKINKAILPSYSKQRLDLTKATKIQMAIFAWKLYVTKNALD
ncbi:SsrA-binding protein [Lacinutrix sp. MedPE-SW]|uniref:SsrA-binding protein n=1 Tax=Lacinutrix sp. MedPE-SW TaxID=1860087 RepID=UPI00091B517F|nr:SsrA-binding protein [Lacinutrix sp. MedPE-SW]OIQ19450.1 MAG: SsrA-binding protein [Lacinutrix sp. MedPE-SW]